MDRTESDLWSGPLDLLSDPIQLDPVDRIDLVRSDCCIEGLGGGDGDRVCTNINLGWAKLMKYYTKTDLSAAYVAALILHPRYNWCWLKKNSAPAQLMSDCKTNMILKAPCLVLASPKPVFAWMCCRKN